MELQENFPEQALPDKLPTSEEVTVNLHDVFDPLRIINVGLIEYELTYQLSPYPETSRKFRRLCEYMNGFYRGGNHLLSLFNKAIKKNQELDHENANLRKQLEELRNRIEFYDY